MPLKLTKRQKFLGATIILVVGIVLTRLGIEVTPFRLRELAFVLLTLIVSILALKDEDFSGVEWLTLPILPTFFAVSASLIFPLLPSRVESLIIFPNLTTETAYLLALAFKLVFLCVFMIGYYATLLTANIFNVAAVRSIQLLRVAHSIGFLMTVSTALLLYIVISSFHFSPVMNAVLVFAVTFPLTLNALWSVNIESEIGKPVRYYSLLTSLILAEIAWALSFWPVGVSLYALFLTAVFYELIGILQYHLGEKLSRRVANEFIIVAISVFLLTILTTVWGA